MEGGVEVVDAEITAMQLDGYSLTGFVRVTENESMASTGEIRSQQAGQEYPASLSFDVYLRVSLLTLHNNIPLHITSVDDITSWPPEGINLEFDTPYNVDDDGDGAVDEDSSDDDGDRAYDEDRPGADPDIPGGGSECPPNPDCDDEEGEDPPVDLCPPAADAAETLCDQDADGQIDEDPSCIPLFNQSGASLKAGACVREAAFTLQDPGSITPIPSPMPSVTATRTPTVMPTPTRTATPQVLVGDVDCNTIINAIDAALILQRTAGLLMSLPCGGAADANLDGQVNAIDSALILQYSAGLIGQLPP